MQRVLLRDWKGIVLQFWALFFTISTLVFTSFQHNAYSFLSSFVAILFIGLTMRRASQLIS